MIVLFFSFVDALFEFLDVSVHLERIPIVQVRKLVRVHEFGSAMKERQTQLEQEGLSDRAWEGSVEEGMLRGHGNPTTEEMSP